MSGEGERADAYLKTIERLEPNIAMIDASAFYASVAISQKRQADALEKIANALKFHEGGYNLIDILYQIMERQHPR